MQLAPVSLLAVGLAMDATAAAAALGAAPGEGRRLPGALRVGLLFGAFQAVMPLGGWLIGARFGSLVADWDHWIAFALLTAIAAKMAWEGLRSDRSARPDGPAGARVLVLLAFATSVDAFAAGLTLPLIGAPVGVSLVIIFAVTAGLSSAAFLFGARLARGVGRWIELAGAALLFAVGLRILVSHLG